MIDFWELTGRLVLMPADQRRTEIYEGIMPIQATGCILTEPGFCDKPALPLSTRQFFNPLRDYIAATYRDEHQKSLLFSPAVSMFALGETGTMFFNEAFRKLFEDLSAFLKTTSVIQDRDDKTSDSMFYIALGVVILDSTVRDSVATSGKFAGVQPASLDDQKALRALSADPTFTALCDAVCFDGEWTEGSVNTLLGQDYPRPGRTPGSPAGKPHRHIRFIGLQQ